MLLTPKIIPVTIAITNNTLPTRLKVNNSFPFERSSGFILSNTCPKVKKSFPFWTISAGDITSMMASIVSDTG